MGASGSVQLTNLLARASHGDLVAAAEAFARVNHNLREIAKKLFVREAPGNTLQPTVMVNEAWLKLRAPDGGLKVCELASRAQFFAIAAKVMRQILVDHARSRNRQKRGGGQTIMALDDADSVAQSRQAEVMDVDKALKRLEANHPRAARVVELRYFTGCTNPETAAVLGVSPETVKNDWRFAKAFLRRELKDD